jgi:predicted  nucleic acid-binding Zn-ribbon protein
MLQVEALKQAMLVERDKLKAERENSQVTEELAARTTELEKLKEQLQSCDKEWQAKLNAETDRWQARLAEQQQDVETERDKMAEAIAGIMCSSFWEEEV